MIYRVAFAALLALAVVSCSRKADQGKPSLPAEVHVDPRKLSDAFVKAVVKDPVQALSLMEEDYQTQTDPNRFVSLVQMMLPADAGKAQIQFVKAEEGFMEIRGEDTIPSSEYHYRLVSKGGAQPSVIEVHVVCHGDAYYVSRFVIPSM